jgi:hypothetical protein
MCVCKENYGKKETDENVGARTVGTRHMKLGMKVCKHTYYVWQTVWKSTLRNMVTVRRFESTSGVFYAYKISAEATSSLQKLNK